jgi:hypothetical protein
MVNREVFTSNFKIGTHQRARGRSEASQESFASKYCCEYDIQLAFFLVCLVGYLLIFVISMFFRDIWELLERMIR